MKPLAMAVTFALLQTVSIIDCCCGSLCGHKGACEGCGSACVFAEPAVADC